MRSSSLAGGQVWSGSHPRRRPAPQSDRKYDDGSLNRATETASHLDPIDVWEAKIKQNHIQRSLTRNSFKISSPVPASWVE
jgi:hypothetical protein